jgi:hypothetical protein
MPNQYPTIDGQNVMGATQFFKDANDVAQPLGGAAATPIFVQAATSGGTVRTPGYDLVTDAATIAAGAKSVTIENVGVADGTVQTKSFPVGRKVSWSVDGADVLGAIAYVATGTTFAIAKVT